MRRAVFTQTHAVMCVDKDRTDVREGGDADRRPHVVREYEKRSPIRNDSAVQRHAIQRSAHGVLAHTKVQVATAAVIGGELGGALELGVVRRRQIGRAPEQFGHLPGKGREDLP